MKLSAGRRWLVTTLAAMAAFGGCWLGLALARVWDAGAQIGVSSVPLVVLLAVLSAWAERARDRETQRVDTPKERSGATVTNSAQAQGVGSVGHSSVNIGPGASLPNAVFNLGGGSDRRKKPLSDPASSEEDALVDADAPHWKNQRLLAKTEEAHRSGSELPVWSIPARNRGFTGREELLVATRRALVVGGKAVVQALRGMGGVGKTQLAIEYAHRFADSYEVAWWVNSGQSGLIGDQFAELGAALGCVDADARIEVVRSAVHAELRRRSQWLLVFDNAYSAADIRPWLPGGNGHVLITSRERGWEEIAAPIAVDILARVESVAMLQDRVAGLTEADADRLAAGLGDLPLALAQAAGFMNDTGIEVEEYISLLATRSEELLALGTPISYPRSLAAATQLIADRLAEEDQAAAELATLCAFMAPEPIPADLFTDAATELPADLADRAADPLAWRQTLGYLTRQSLARIDHHSLVMHRLTQAILRVRLSPDQAAAARACTETILVATDLNNAEDSLDTWPRWAQLMPHLFAADLGATDNPGLRWLACRACGYLLSRGDVRTAHELASGLRQQWRDRLGGDDESVLEASHYVTWTSHLMGYGAEVRDLAEDTLNRARRILGKNHPHTLTYANQLAIALRDDLADLQAAWNLDRDILDRRRQVLGENHPNTLRSMGNLANDLNSLGELQAACDLYQDALNRMRHVLGENHPDTLLCGMNLAGVLEQLGEMQAACHLAQDSVDRMRGVLGEGHPNTIHSASNLALFLYNLGDIQAARDLARHTSARAHHALGEDHPDTRRAAEILAAVLRARRGAQVLAAVLRALGRMINS